MQKQTSYFFYSHLDNNCKSNFIFYFIVKYLYYFKCLQDWQHTYNVTLRHIHETTVALEKQ